MHDDCTMQFAIVFSLKSFFPFNNNNYNLIYMLPFDICYTLQRCLHGPSLLHKLIINFLMYKPKLRWLNVPFRWLFGCLTARQHRKVNLCQLQGRETGLVG